MALDLQAVLDHPAFAHSCPEVVAGDPAGRVVRWVHSSEIYDIAPLLRGHELLLTTGLGLAGRSLEELRAYVAALDDRGVAGVALELRTFPDVPAAMVEEARARGLPLVALRQVWPFVEVTQGINSAILESSVTRLQHSETVGRALSRALAAPGSADTLARALAGLLGSPVVVTDPVGHVVASAAARPEDGEGDPAAVLASPRATASIESDGLLLGGLAIGPGEAPPELVAAAVERSPEFFAVEVMRGDHQSLLHGRERRDVLRDLAAAAPGAVRALAEHAATAGIRPGQQWAGLAVEGAAGLAVAQDLARRAGAQLVAAEDAGVTLALLACPSWAAPRLTERVRGAVTSPGAPVAIGPVVSLRDAGRSLRAARQALSLPSRVRGGDRLVVAEDAVVERLLAWVPDRTALQDLVEEQLGPVLRAPSATSLLDTLETYVDCGCSKAETARRLHLRRQSVHQRLARVEQLLGHELAVPGRLIALRLALGARRSLGM